MPTIFSEPEPAKSYWIDRSVAVRSTPAACLCVSHERVIPVADPSRCNPAYALSVDFLVRRLRSRVENSPGFPRPIFFVDFVDFGDVGVPLCCGFLPSERFACGEMFFFRCSPRRASRGRCRSGYAFAVRYWLT